jgi:hypothetical protein
MTRLLYDGGDDVKCPHCEREYSVEWDTEYGDPLRGESVVYCTNLECLKKFFLETDVEITYGSRPIG